MKDKGLQIEIPESVIKKIFNKINSIDKKVTTLLHLGSFWCDDAYKYFPTASEDVIDGIQITFLARTVLCSPVVFIIPRMYSAAEGGIYYRLAPPIVYLKERGYDVRDDNDDEEEYSVYDIHGNPRFFLKESLYDQIDTSKNIDVFQLVLWGPVLPDSYSNFITSMNEFLDFVEDVVDGLYIGYGKISPCRKIVLSYSLMGTKNTSIDDEEEVSGEPEQEEKEILVPSAFSREKNYSSESSDFQKKFKQLSNKERELFNSIYVKKLTPLTFADVGGQKKAKEILQKISSFFKYPDIYQAYGVSLPNGILFYGPPGTGKTLSAKVIAYENGAHFFNVNTADIYSKWVGDAEKNIRSVFRIGELFAPSIMFLDELDSFGRSRDDESHEVYRKVLLALCTYLDGFNPLSGVLVIGATNRKEDLDAALLRAGRFTWEVEFTEFSKTEILEEVFPIHIKIAEREKSRYGIIQEPLFGVLDWNKIAVSIYKEMTGADAAAIIKDLIFDKATRHVSAGMVELPISTEDFVKKIEEYKRKNTKFKSPIGF